MFFFLFFFICAQHLCWHKVQVRLKGYLHIEPAPAGHKSNHSSYRKDLRLSGTSVRMMGWLLLNGIWWWEEKQCDGGHILLFVRMDDSAKQFDCSLPCVSLIILPVRIVFFLLDYILWWYFFQTNNNNIKFLIYTDASQTSFWTHTHTQSRSFRTDPCCSLFPYCRGWPAFKFLRESLRDERTVTVK